MRPIHISTSDFDSALIPPQQIEQVKRECRHTLHPAGYGKWHEWARQASKSHSQVRCKRCGLWAVWLPKKEARKVNKEDRKNEREAVKGYEELWESRK